MAAKVEGEAVIKADGSQAGNEMEKLRKRAEKLKREFVELSKANDAKGMAEKRKEIRATEKQMRELGKTTVDVTKTIEELDKASPKELNASIKQLRKEMNNLGADTQEYLDKEKQLQQLEGRYRELRQRQRGVGIETKKNTGLTGAFGSKAKNIYAAVAVAVAAVITKMVQYREQIAKSQQEVAAFTGLAGADLTRITRDIEKFQKFGAEQRDVLKAANTLVNTFGKTWDEALDIIQDGFEKGADLSGEWLSSISEYSTQFKAAGASIEDLTEVSIIAGRTGVFSDKAPDAIKEGMLRIREMNKATKEALQGIGIDADKMLKRIKGGQITLFDAMKEVSAQLKTLPSNAQEVGKVLADVFGGAGEDAGLDFLKVLQDIDGEMTDITVNITESEKASRKLEDAWIDFRFAVLGQDSWFTKAIDATKVALADLLNFFTKEQSEALKSEQENITRLVSSLALAQKGTDAWKKIRDDIKKQHPDLLKNLKLEDVTSKNLSSTLEKLNEHYDRKIKIASAEEGINELMEQRNELQEEEADILVRVNELFEETTGKKGESLNLDQKLNVLRGRSVKLHQIFLQNSKEEEDIQERLNQIKKERESIDFEYSMLLDSIRQLKKSEAQEDNQLTKTTTENSQTRIEQQKKELEAAKKHQAERKKLLEELEQLRKDIASRNVVELVEHRQAFEEYLQSIRDRSEEQNELEGNQVREFTELLNEEQQKREDERIRRQKKELEDAVAISEEVARVQTEALDEMKILGVGFAQELGSVFGQFLVDQEGSIKTFGQNAISIMLDVVKRYIELAIAQATGLSLASPESVATFGAAGVAKAAALTIAIEAAFAAAKSVVTQGFFDGGHTGTGANNEPAGIVHKNEYVVPASGVNNPAINSVLQVIETARTSGTLQTLDYTRIASAMPKKGYQEGGFVGFQENQVPDTQNQQNIERLSMLMVRSISAMNGRVDRLQVQNNARDTDEKLQEYLQVRNDASA